LFGGELPIFENIYKPCHLPRRNKEDLFGPKGVNMERKNPLPKNGSGFGSLSGLS